MKSPLKRANFVGTLISGSDVKRVGEKTDKRSLRQAEGLVDKLYATVLKPERYDELIAAWESHVASAMHELGDRAGAPGTVGDEVERHFLNAFTILERLGRRAPHDEPLETTLEQDPRPALLVDRAGQIVFANTPARDLFAAEVGMQLSTLPMEADGAANFRRLLTAIDREPAGRLLSISRVFSSRDNSAFVVALSRAEQPDDSAPLGLVSLADLVWTDRINEVVQQAFGLSPAESAVLGLLISGRSATEIAEARKTSVETVRTQIRSVLRKTEAHSQAELIRMTAALAQLDISRDERRAAATISNADRFETLSIDGRKLAFARIGASDGRPILFLHGMIDGCSAPLFNRRLLEERDLCAMVPARPGYGPSDPYSPGDDPAGRLADDLEKLLDHLGIERCAVVGHFGGALYAYAFAQRHAKRVSAVVNISGTVPITSAAQIAAFGPRQRIIAYTSRVVPRVSKLILRAGVALLDKGGHEAFMKALYERSAVDYEFARKRHVLPYLADGYDFSAAQGYAAFQADAMATISDWSTLVKAVRAPVTLIHGAHDPATPISLVRDLADQVDGIELVELPALGQLHFYAEPEATLEAIDQAAQRC